jgi:hypothetical protein
MAFTKRDYQLMGHEMLRNMGGAINVEWFGRLLLDPAFAKAQAKILISDRRAKIQGELDLLPAEQLALETENSDLSTLDDKL